MDTTPLANRLAIAIFGRRNAGKSSLINAITGQEVSLISEVAGTTTDPVHKTMELLPVGPVVFYDTPGLDDEGALGRARVERAYEVLRKAQFALVVAAADEGVTAFERDFIAELKSRGIPALLVLNKADLRAVPPEELAALAKELGVPAAAACARTGEGVAHVRELIAQNARFDDAELGLVGDLVPPGGTAVLVVPIDKAAPKGRLILPQQQVIRDLLECDAAAVVTKEQELRAVLQKLSAKPDLVITDSQAFLKVSADTPPDVPLTSFSILLARQKGDLAELVRGVGRIASLREGERVLIAEGCTHHRQSDDIATVKIPRWIRQLAGGGVEFEWASGARFPEDLSPYAAVVHCGGCMLNRREMLWRMAQAKRQSVAITNYGLLIAYVQGILERSLAPFPAAALAYKRAVAGGARTQFRSRG